MGHTSSAAVAASTSPDGDFDYKKHLMMQKGAQSEVDDQKVDGYSPVYREQGVKEVWNKGCSLLCDNEKKDKFATDIYTMFLDGVQKHQDLNLQGWRKYDADGELEMKYTWATFKEVREIVDRIACALSKSDIKKEMNVGLFAKNRPEWFQCMIANSCVGARTVALYDTLGEEALVHILKQAQITVLFTEKHKLPTLKKILKEIDHFVKEVVVFDHQEMYGNAFEKLEEEKEWGTDELPVKMTGMSEFLKKGEGVKVDDIRAEISEGDLCNIMYTSGTTGLPKGVMLTHIGVMCAVHAANARIGTVLEPGGRHYSYLPLAHIFELMVELACVNMGLGIAFTQGNIKKLAEDLGLVEPNLFIGVPRIYSKFHDKFWVGVNAGSGLKKKMAKDAFKASSAYIRDNVRSGFYDKVVWKKVAKKMGLSKVKIAITGAAPMPGYLMEFIKIVTKAPMIQGYGLTETTASGAISGLKDTTVGHNGTPPMACEVRLADVPEMNYTSADVQDIDGEKINCPRGEIQIRGPVVFQGYYKMPEKTKEVLTDDGWFCTGDIGRINPNGTLSIIDRKKNIFKLSQGEYIAVEKVENAYAKSGYVNQVWVYGNSYKPKIVAIVVPDALQVTTQILKDDWDAKGTTPATPEWNKLYFEATQSKEVREKIKKVVFDDMKRYQGKLKGFEKIADITCEYEVDNILQGFNVGNNCLTPSFKLKRPQLKARYMDSLKAMYTAMNDPPADGEEW